MGDLSGINSSISTKLVGSDASGVETYPVASSGSLELNTADSCRTSGLEAVVALTTTAVILKVGGSPLADRKYLILEAQDNNIKWGFSSTCVFNLFKNEKIVLPMGVAVYAKMIAGTGNIAIGECS